MVREEMENERRNTALELARRMGRERVDCMVEGEGGLWIASGRSRGHWVIVLFLDRFRVQEVKSPSLGAWLLL